ncbi:hypothetical protein M514_07354, partial [Trichuris suis]|uniref:Uncharacterized protein n=1 Tax=Trichuris suis TaxID=68888 RepID=A0A085M3N1_9BILA
MATGGEEQHDRLSEKEKVEGHSDGTAASPEVPLHVSLSTVAKKFGIFMDIYRRMTPHKQLEHLMRLLEEYAKSQVAFKRAAADGHDLTAQEMVAACDLLSKDGRMKKVISEVARTAKEQLANFQLTPRLLAYLNELRQEQDTE